MDEYFVHIDVHQTRGVRVDYTNGANTANVLGALDSARLVIEEQFRASLANQRRLMDLQQEGMAGEGHV